MMFFFFSSRRRHTRYGRDWSSDVCSSDLGQTVKVAANQAWFEYIPARVSPPSGSLAAFGAVAVQNVKIDKWDGNGLEIGRTSCRERVEISVVAASLKKKKLRISD